jgi:hypothetical protein
MLHSSNRETGLLGKERIGKHESEDHYEINRNVLR